LAVLPLFALLLVGCHQGAPKNIHDACAIYREFPDWLAVGKQVKRRWGTPLSLQLAIIYTESRFKATAHPKREALHVFNKSSALGYAQALNSVWRLYVHSTHQLAADRENFADASDFIGWYTHHSKRRLGLPYSNAYAHYLAFHEGWGGYARGSYQRQAHLKRVAKRLQQQSARYHKQLLACGSIRK
jgi:hypothetical protein